MENERRFYVYHWINDDTGLPFYVGKGSGRRYKDTKRGSRNPWFDRIVAKHKCHPEIIIQNLTEEEAFALEIEKEKEYKAAGYELCNIIPCGSAPPHGFGPDNNNYHNYWSDEKKELVSKKMRETKCHAGTRNGRCRKCMCVETGVVYNYLTEAMDAIGAKCVWSIGRCLKDYRLKAKGFHFVGEEMFEALNTEEKRKAFLDSVISNSRFAQQCA